MVDIVGERYVAGWEEYDFEISTPDAVEAVICALEREGFHVGRGNSDARVTIDTSCGSGAELCGCDDGKGLALVRRIIASVQAHRPE